MWSVIASTFLVKVKFQLRNFEAVEWTFSVSDTLDVMLNINIRAGGRTDGRTDGSRCVEGLACSYSEVRMRFAAPVNSLLLWFLLLLLLLMLLAWRIHSHPPCESRHSMHSLVHACSHSTTLGGKSAKNYRHCRRACDERTSERTTCGLAGRWSTHLPSSWLTAALYRRPSDATAAITNWWNTRTTNYQEHFEYSL